MPNISVADQQSLANELSTRLQALNASTPNADLVYLTRMIEIFNGNANLSAVSSEGTTQINAVTAQGNTEVSELQTDCLLYTSPSPRDRTRSRMPSSA